MSKGQLQPPRGTRDFYPEDQRLRDWLFGHFRAVARQFAFEEVDAPIVEHAELFIRKAGEEIVEQLYHFTLHDRHLALRGEMTPSIARMVIARAGALRMPLRWFMVGQNWRYERMTRGRRREHYQWNVELIGEPTVTAEAELISAIFGLLDALGLPRDAVQLRINSRALLEESLRRGVLASRPELFGALCVIIDKIDKIGPEAVTGLLCDAAGPVALSQDEARDAVAMLEARSLEQAARFVGEDSDALAELRQLFDLLDAYGVADRCIFDASVVRGLAYYTGVVFEAFDSERNLRAICGGGRYDRMIEGLGGPSLPAVGFGFGDAVIVELLSDLGLLPDLPRRLDDMVYARSEAERPAAIRVARALRRQDRQVELVLGSPSMKRAMKDADRAGAARIWLIGPEELSRSVATVRDLQTGDQHEEKLPD